MKYIKLNKSEPEVNRDNKKGYGFTSAKTSRCNYGFIRAIRDLTIGQQVRIIRDFVNAISEGTPLLAPGSEGIKALSLINAIYLSAYRERALLSAR
jgi:predicted dehydrogenase